MRKMNLHWVLVEFTVRFFVGIQPCYLIKRQHPVCVQEKANDPSKYFKDTCVIKSPVTHPGDGTYICMLTPIQVILISLTVQRVYAVGEPPEDKVCFFRGLKMSLCFQLLVRVNESHVYLH